MSYAQMHRHATSVCIRRGCLCVSNLSYKNKAHCLKPQVLVVLRPYEPKLIVTQCLEL